MNKVLYRYEADTQHAQVFSRLHDGVLCDVFGVDLLVGNLLCKPADEAHQQGYEMGRKEALQLIANRVIDEMQR